MNDIVVNPRVHQRHADVSDSDVIYAWKHIVKSTRRDDTDPVQYAAVGFDEHNRLLEMCAVLSSDGDWVIFHAMKATPKMLNELGIV